MAAARFGLSEPAEALRDSPIQNGPDLNSSRNGSSPLTPTPSRMASTATAAQERVRAERPRRSTSRGVAATAKASTAAAAIRNANLKARPRFMGASAAERSCTAT